MTRTDTHRVVWGADPAGVTMAQIDAADASAVAMAAWDAPTDPEPSYDDVIGGMRVAVIAFSVVLAATVGGVIAGLWLGGTL